MTEFTEEHIGKRIVSTECWSNDEIKISGDDRLVRKEDGN